MTVQLCARWRTPDDRQVTAYNYIDPAGRLAYQNVRVQRGEAQKRFFQRRPDGEGGWRRGLGSPRAVPHLPFNLPDLFNEANSELPVLIHEGEKAALLAREALPGWVHLATGGHLGRVKHYAPLLAGRAVGLVADNDEAGRRGAQAAARILLGQDEPPDAVRVVELPGLPERGDCADWLAAGGEGPALQAVWEASPPVCLEGERPAAPAAPRGAPGPGFLPRLAAAKALPVRDLVGADTRLKPVTSDGTELAGPCPFCGGEDRFHLHTGKNAWFCRRCTGEPGPGRPWRSTVDYLMGREGLTLSEAVDRLVPPPEDEQPPPDPGAKPRWRFLTVEQVRRLPPIDYLVAGKVPRGGLVLLYGPSGVGKSFYALDLSLQVAQEAAVFYLAGEGQNGYADRVRAWEAHHGQSGGRFYLSAVGLPSLLDARLVEGLIAAIREAGPALVVVDTLAYAMAGGDENAQKDMGRLVANLNRVQRETGAAVLVVHHTNKSGRSPRGSTVLPYGADTVLEVSGGDGVFSVSCVKAKDAAPFDDEHYRLVEVPTRDGASSLVPVPTSRAAAPATGKLTPNQRRVLEVLSMTAFRRAGCKASILRDESHVPAGSLYRTLSQLMDCGFVSQDQRGDPYFITEAGLGQVGATINYHAAGDSDRDSDSAPAASSIIAITTRKGDSDDSDERPLDEDDRPDNPPSQLQGAESEAAEPSQPSSSSFRSPEEPDPPIRRHDQPRPPEPPPWRGEYARVLRAAGLHEMAERAAAHDAGQPRAANGPAARVKRRRKG